MLEKVRNYMEPNQKSNVDVVAPEHRVHSMSLLSNWLCEQVRCHGAAAIHFQSFLGARHEDDASSQLWTLVNIM